MTWCSSAPPPERQIEMYSKNIGGNTFIDYEKDPELEQLLLNKTIAFVGPSNNIVGKDMGSFIDSHDIVIRPGQLTFLDESLHTDYGKKTDIIFHSFNSWEKEIANSNIEFLQTLKYVVGCMVCISECGGYEKFMNNLISKGIKFHKPNDRYIFRNFRDVGTTLSCGISSLLILLNYDIKSVYITGMDFYNMGKYGKVYRDDYFNTVSKSSRGHIPHNNNHTVSPHAARNDLHNQDVQISHLRKLVSEDKRIILDEYLTNNL